MSQFELLKEYGYKQYGILFQAGFLLLKLNLAITDLMLLFFYALPKLLWNITYEWKGTDSMCKCVSIFDQAIFSESHHQAHHPFQDAQLPVDGLVLPVVQYHCVHCAGSTENGARGEQDKERQEYGRCTFFVYRGLKSLAHDTVDELLINDFIKVHKFQRSIRLLIFFAWFFAFAWSLPQFVVFQVNFGLSTFSKRRRYTTLLVHYCFRQWTCSPTATPRGSSARTCGPSTRTRSCPFFEQATFGKQRRGDYTAHRKAVGLSPAG